MIADIQCWYKEHEVSYDIVCFPFSGPYNIGMITTPPISPPVKIQEVGSHLNKSDQITEIRGVRRQFKVRSK
ncbi:hypothetical protein QUA00_05595 [Microcoleus sp. T2B6]|uniref:hypothetical protein n=1 Tax=Microcoleus sp. T2B6 TaxID=3055424 RepID=UPI002FD6142D